ncbi:MAG: hypothetical protein K2L04_08835 [Alistipes sp.]|nr:hypothetical protein [Alistipes sp.]
MRFFEEIAAREDRNLYEIVLYPEGLFYKAYERSAFACVSRVSPFKPSKKHLKYCARDMVSVGFPAAVLSKYFPSAPQPLADGRVVIALTDRIDPVASEMWKASLPLKERQPRGSAHRMTGAAVLPLAERPMPLFARPAALRPAMPAEPGPKVPMPGVAAPLPKLRPERDALELGAARDVPGFRTERDPAAVRPERGAAAVRSERDMSAVRTERDMAAARTERVARLIREFRLEAATPVECLLFVADLKKEIDGYL